MPDRELATELSLVIRGRTIKVEKAPPGVFVPEASLQLDPDDDPLRRETIDVLVEMLRDGRLFREAEFKVLGAKLYSVLLQNPIGDALHQLRYEGGSYVRISLRFEDDEYGLAAWPWEYMYRPRGRGGEAYFLGREPKVVITRNSLEAESRSIQVEKEPVKVLFVAASPIQRDNDEFFDEVDFRPILKTIKDYGECIKLLPLLPGGEGAATSEELPATPTFENLTAVAKTFQPDVIHFVAHGKWHRGHGELILMRPEDDGPSRRTDEWLASELMGISSLKLVFLQACESARMDRRTNARSAASGLAMELALRRIPAVVAMQYEVGQVVANRFANAFYNALVEMRSVDAAVLFGRQQVRNWEEDQRNNQDENAPWRPAFGLPVLYLSRSDPLFPSRTAGSTTPSGGPPTWGLRDRKLMASSLQSMGRNDAGEAGSGLPATPNRHDSEAAQPPAMLRPRLATDFDIGEGTSAGVSGVCPSCMHAYQPGAKFCVECGEPIPQPALDTRDVRAV